MANTTIYIIDTTDGSDNFAIQPRTFDGAGGVQQHTDVTLYGNAAPNWGEKFNENFYKLVENFAVHQQEVDDPNYSATIPRPKSEDSKIDSTLPDAGTDMLAGTGINNAIPGQGWFNKTDQKIYVCTTGGLPGAAAWKAIGAGTSQPPNPTMGDLWYDAANSELKVYNGAAFVSSAGNYVLKTGDTMNLNADITFNGGEVFGLPVTPTTQDAAASKDYVDNVAGAAGAVLKIGDTMTGQLVLPVYVETNTLQAASQQYVLDKVNGVSGTYVDVIGDTMTGTLNIDGDQASNFTAINLTSLSGPIIKMKTTSTTLSGSVPPAIIMYNPDNHDAITGSGYDYGYLRINNRDSTFLTIEADQDDNGSGSGGNTLTVLQLSQTGPMTYHGNGTTGAIKTPNASIATINTDITTLTTKEYVDDAVTTGVASVGGLQHIETLQYPTYFDVNSSSDVIVSGFDVAYTTPAVLTSNYTFVIRASLNSYHRASAWPTYWTLKEGGTPIDIKTTEGESASNIISNVTMMASGTMVQNTTYTFTLWARNSATAPTQDTRLNANDNYPTGSDPAAPQSTMEIMVFG